MTKWSMCDNVRVCDTSLFTLSLARLFLYVYWTMLANDLGSLQATPTVSLWACGTAPYVLRIGVYCSPHTLSHCTAVYLYLVLCYCFLYSTVFNSHPVQCHEY